MKLKLKLLVVGLSVLSIAQASIQAQVVYDNLGTTLNAAFSQANTAAPIFGDALNLTSGGTLGNFGLSLYNSSSSAGPILTGTTVVKFYDNTTAYAGGVLSNPLLGTATVTWDYTAEGGLAAGFYDVSTFDLSSYNITLTPNIFVTQQFTQTSGTGTRNGIIVFSDPTVGSSPSSLYIKSTATAEGLYTIGGFGQLGLSIELVPEPTTFALAGLGSAALMIFRRRK